jgi:capsular polysaccharide biosynthesis protein
MPWEAYWGILRRRWLLIAVIIVLDALGSGYLYLKAHRQVGYQAALTLYVSDVSAPSVTLETTDQLLSGETAANFFADDILDVAQTSRVASYISQHLRPLHLPSSAASNFTGAIGGSRKDRTVNLTLNNSDQQTALLAAHALGVAMTADRAGFIGQEMAHRTFVDVVSPATVGPAPAGHLLLSLGLRLFLGVLVALGLAFLWDALDPTVRDARDVEHALGLPVLASL